ncbi:MAG: hypothetical protein AB1427_13050 [Thermodesulfobacteriota bacterium]
MKDDLKETLKKAIEEGVPARADPARLQKQRRKTVLFIIASLILIVTAYGAYTSITAPRGKITSPENGYVKSRLVEIEGFTRNIPSARRYIWIIVDVKALGLCWPKRQVYKANEPFKTIIHEKGPNKTFVVSLYAVDRATHDEILKWFEIVRKTESEAGMPMLPDDFRLSALTLTLN